MGWFVEIACQPRGELGRPLPRHSTTELLGETTVSTGWLIKRTQHPSPPYRKSPLLAWTSKANTPAIDFSVGTRSGHESAELLADQPRALARLIKGAPKPATQGWKSPLMVRTLETNTPAPGLSECARSGHASTELLADTTVSPAHQEAPNASKGRL